jgi:hypothetical protein
MPTKVTGVVILAKGIKMETFWVALPKEANERNASLPLLLPFSRQIFANVLKLYPQKLMQLVAKFVFDF